MYSFTVRNIVPNLNFGSQRKLLSLRLPTNQLGKRRWNLFSTLSDPDREVRLDLLEGNDVGIATISLNRPSAKNALGRVCAQQMLESFNFLYEQDNVRVAIIRSEVKGVFCAGADLKERLKMTQSEVAEFLGTLRQCLPKVGGLPIPTIAALDGAALGGGLEIALWCDLRIVSEDARVGLVETKLAIIPGGGGTQNLPRIIGKARAKELIYTGRVIQGKDAETLGLANYCVPQNDRGDAAYLRSLELAREIAPNGPVALRMAKRAIDSGLDGSLSAGVAIEWNCYKEVIPTEDRIEGLKAFKEKRPPVYKGR